MKRLIFWLFLLLLTIAYLMSFWSRFSISVYGMVMGCMLLLQVTGSTVNFYMMRKASNTVDVSNERVSTVVVGYREDSVYWKRCLESIKAQSFIANMDIVISIDGDEKDDLYMQECAAEVFDNSVAYKVLLNKHGGKRSALLHAFRYLLNDDIYTPYIVLVDSDTILDTNAVEELTKSIHSSDKIGCATSNISIFNQSNLLTKIVNARYSYAFNVERSYQSAFGVMTCCSGPLSIYRSSVLLHTDFLDRFEKQSIFKCKIEPGDDRHLTLMVMKSGFQSKLCPFSRCSTESPETFGRFLRQQLRWMRSFFRENYWQYKCLDSQPVVLSFISVYELMFPFYIFGWICYLMACNASVEILLKSVALTSLVSCARTAIVVSYTRNANSMYNGMYLFLYLFALLPIKMYAFATMREQGWMTSSRRLITANYSMDCIAMICIVALWNTFIIMGCLRTCLSLSLSF